MPMQTIESASPCATLGEAQVLLAHQGWVVLPPHLLHEGTRAALAHFGRIVPQYDGQETWEVKAKAGYEAVPYSQSANGIGAHTEAPVMDPPPRYLALHCHQQAACGGGHTILADGLAFCERNGGIQHFTEREIDFVATPTPGSAQQQKLRTPLLSRRSADVVFRFSYNLFRYGDVNPSEDAIVASGTALNRDAALVQLSTLAESFFDAEGVALLVPENTVLIWDNHRMMHARTRFEDIRRHLTRYWLA